MTIFLLAKREKFTVFYSSLHDAVDKAEQDFVTRWSTTECYAHSSYSGRRGSDAKQKTSMFTHKQPSQHPSREMRWMGNLERLFAATHEAGLQ